jgi:hypothetical protein
MSIVKQWQQLPRTIDHVGYTFQLEFRPFANCLYVGYFVNRVFATGRDKKTAFSLGYWTDKRAKYHTSSVGTPLLTGVPLFFEDDAELSHSLQTLYRYVVENFGYTPFIKADTRPVDAEFEELRPLSIAAVAAGV